MLPAISIEHLTKTYRLGALSGASLNEDLARWWAGVRRKPDPLAKVRGSDHARQEGKLFWALDDVSCDIQEGEIIGVIGRNGAGKSTLLKILSQVTAPSAGRIEIRGRVASLLEVGTGFHPDLSGRENVFLNGAIMGMTKAEIKRKFDEIVAFSECEAFIDTPVKRYSSGMYVRLAFAVAAHLEPEILVVDEVLAVGDAEFQKKCLGKMGEVSRGGRTVLFVSHNVGAILTLTGRCLFLQQGRVRAVGPTREVVDLYAREGASSESEDLTAVSSKFFGARFTKVHTTALNGLRRSSFAQGEPFVVHLQVEIVEPTPLVAAAAIETNEGVPLFSTSTTDFMSCDETLPVGPRTLSVTINPVHLRDGPYKVSLWLFRPRTFEIYQAILHVPLVTVEGADSAGDFPPGNDPRWGRQYFRFTWSRS